MSAPVTILAKAWSDRRLRQLGALLEPTVRPIVQMSYGRDTFMQVLSLCTDNGTARLAIAELEARFPHLPELARQLVIVGLAEALDWSTIRVRCGDTKNVLWLAQQREQSEKGGRARAAQAQRDDQGRFTADANLDPDASRPPAPAPPRQLMLAPCAQAPPAGGPAGAGLQPNTSASVPDPAPDPVSVSASPQGDARARASTPGGDVVNSGTDVIMRSEARATPTPEANRTRSASPEAVEVAMYLLSSIKAHNPGQRGNDQTALRWAEEIELAIRCDARTPAAMKRAIDFAHRPPHKHWARIVMSGAQLRAKFDELTVDMNTRSAHGSNGGSKALSAAELRAIAEHGGRA